MTPRERLKAIDGILEEWDRDCGLQEYTDTEVLWSNVIPDIRRLCDMEDTTVFPEMPEYYHVEVED